MRHLATVLTLFALTCAIFGSWMHVGVLDPRHIGWLLEGGDRGVTGIGMAAYLKAGSWPSLHEPLLVAPEGLPLLLTDSIPLIGVVLGPFARALPAAQYVGLWLFTCVGLQVGFAWALIRPRAPDALTALLGTALLAAMPALLNRYLHPSLCAQWLVLWALWVFVDARRARNPLWWLAILSIATLVHSCLLVIVAAFWGSALLASLLMKGDRARTLLGAVVVAAAVLLLAAWQGVLGAGYVPSGLYGQFPMALDAWWNPANPGYAALIPSSPETNGYEGLQYLGAGNLLLVVLGLGIFLSRRTHGDLAPLRWLLPAFAVLALIAVGPVMYWRSAPLIALHLPRSLIDLLDPVRASGRLAWPLTYTLVYAAIVAVMRLRRATVWIAAAVALQVIDFTPMLTAIRETSAHADDAATYRRAIDPRWATLLDEASAVEFEPAKPYADLPMMEEVGWRAVMACRPMRYFYAARISRPTLDRLHADRAAFEAGKLDPTRLYVILDGQVPPSIAGRVEWLDGTAIVPPTVHVPPPRCATSSPRSAS